MIKPSLGALALVPALLVGCAQEKPAEETPAVIQNLAASGLQVVRTFEAPSEMTGYIVDFQGQPQVMYLTPDKKHVIAGVMVDENGESLTMNHMEQYAPKPDYAALWEQAEKSTWVAEGAKEPKSVVYALADPHCPFCNAFWKASQAYHDAGLQVRWVLVNYLRPDGAAKVATILGSDNPEQAFKQHESNFADGGIEPAAEPKPELLKTVQANTELMDQMRITGTPAVIFKDAEGKVQLLQGMPSLKALPEIFQLPEQEIKDPSLARFQ